MNTKTAIAALSLLCALSCSAFAADSINSEQAKGRESLGSVSVSAIDASPMDLHAALDKKADEKGASAYRVIEAREGDNWHVTAELYK